MPYVEIFTVTLAFIVGFVTILGMTLTARHRILKMHEAQTAVSPKRRELEEVAREVLAKYAEFQRESLMYMENRDASTRSASSGSRPSQREVSPSQDHSSQEG